VTQAGEHGKTLMQVFGIAAGVAIMAMVWHKLFVDISALAQQHSGDRFWWALARYFINNLAGG
jgi:hypothetical protein